MKKMSIIFILLKREVASMLWFLIIGIIAGWLAGNIMKGGGFGLIGDLVVGVIGSFVGGYVFSFFGLSAYGTIGEIIMATVGAVVLLAVIRLFK
jgi:uncharacterized membrane protein YeaQ/YmgE (transglycosylase-associated protein family)